MKKTLINYAQQPKKNDEFFTPEFVVKVVLPFLKPKSFILCPFDDEKSNFVKVLRGAGHTVINSVYNEEAQEGFSFFDYKANSWLDDNVDYIISNPPYSKKNKVLKHLYELGKPFMMLMPLTTLESQYRNNLFSRYGIEVLVIDKRIQFMKDKKSNWFNTSYFCWKVLPKPLMFLKLEKE